MLPNGFGRLGFHRRQSPRAGWPLPPGVRRVGSVDGEPSRSVVVVTGAAGAIGRRVVALLAEAPDVRRRRHARPPAGRRGPPQGRAPPGRPAPAGGRRSSWPSSPGRPTSRPSCTCRSRRAPSVAARARWQTEVTRRVLDAASGRRTSATSWCCRRPPSTARGPTTRSPSPRTRRCARCRTSPTRSATPRSSSWSSTGPTTRRDRTVAVLRPVTGLAEDGSSWLARALAGGAGVLAPEEDPPAQFVHLDDMASAIDAGPPPAAWTAPTT